MAARPGRLITKDDLLKEVWPDSFVEESNLAYHVFALRRALGDTSGERYIETVPKHGYRFSADLRRIEPPDDESVLLEKRTVKRVTLAFENDVEGRPERQLVGARQRLSIQIAAAATESGATRGVPGNRLLHPANPLMD